MGRISRYFMQAGQGLDDLNVLDCTLALGAGPSLDGQQLVIKGSSGLDVVVIDGRFDLDFTESLLGSDVLFIKGWREEFSVSLTGNALRISRSDGLQIRASEGDRLVFLNGTILTHDWITALQAQANTPALDPSLNADGATDDLLTRLIEAPQHTTLVLGYGAGDEASTMAQVLPGAQLVLKGTGLDDVVYVKPGSSVDFSESLGGVDTIYLTGRWADYLKSLNGTVLRLTRGTEEANLGLGDRLALADRSALAASLPAPLPGHPSLEAMGDDWQASPQTPGLDPQADHTPPRVWIRSSVSRLESGQTATIDFYVSEDPGLSFGLDDVAVTGGQLGALSARQGLGTAQSPYHFSATFTPAAQTLSSAQIEVLANRLTDAAGNTNQGVSQLLGGLAIDTLDLRILATADPVVVQRDLANDLPDWAFTAAPDRLGATYSLTLLPSRAQLNLPALWPDAQPNVPGVQWSGTLAQLQAAFAATRITPDPTGVPELRVTLSDAQGQARSAAPSWLVLGASSPSASQIISVDQRAFRSAVSDTFEWVSPIPTSASAMSAAVRMGMFSITAPDGSTRSLGTGATVEPTWPSSLTLSTGALEGPASNTTFQQQSADAVQRLNFTGFKHLGQALQPNRQMPIYASTGLGSTWYLWQAEGMPYRYVLSTASAEGQPWWFGGNSNGFGTASLPREGVLHAGHWFINHGVLNDWQSALDGYWGSFTLSANSVESRWSVSLGQGHTVQPGDRIAYAGKTQALPEDITRPVLQMASVSAWHADGSAWQDAGQALCVGDVLRVVVPASEWLQVLPTQWPGLSQARIGLSIGQTSQWASLDLALTAAAGISRQDGSILTPELVFQYTVAAGDQDLSAGVQVGVVENLFTRLADLSGNRMWTQDRDVPEQANSWRVQGQSSQLHAQAAHVQALIPSYQPHWPDSTPASGRQGDAVTRIKYAYLGDWPAYYADPALIPNKASDSVSFSPWTEGMKATFNHVLMAISVYTLIEFTEVANAADAHLALGAYAMEAGIGGYGYYPEADSAGSTGDEYGDFWLNSDADLNSAWARHAMAHELGHTLGLKHPGNYNAGGGGSPGPFLPLEEDNARYTVMTYHNGDGFGSQYPNDYMLFDIAALQYLYGARTSFADNTDWALGWATRNLSINAIDVVYDSGGVDTLRATDVPAGSGVILNLNQGEFCTVGEIPENIGICYGSEIENAVGSAGNDTLIGNPLDNTLTGGAGADVFVMSASWGHDTITDFVPGTDVISFERDANLHWGALVIQRRGLDTVITHGSDQLTLSGVNAALTEANFQWVL